MTNYGYRDEEGYPKGPFQVFALFGGVIHIQLTHNSTNVRPDVTRLFLHLFEWG